MELYYYDDIVPSIHLYSLPSRTPIYADYYLADRNINFRRLGRRPRLYRSVDTWYNRLAEPRRWLVGIPPTVSLVDVDYPCGSIYASETLWSPYLTRRVKRFCSQEILIYTGPGRIVTIPERHPICAPAVCIHLEGECGFTQGENLTLELMYVVEEPTTDGIILRMKGKYRERNRDCSHLHRLVLKGKNLKYNLSTGMTVKIIIRNGSTTEPSPVPVQPTPDPQPTPTPPLPHPVPPTPTRPDPVPPTPTRPDPDTPTPTRPDPDTPTPRPPKESPTPTPTPTPTPSPQPPRPDPVQPDPPDQTLPPIFEIRKCLPSLEMDDCVLARWEDDRWYYKGKIVRQEGDKQFRVCDLTGREGIIWREDIIPVRDNYFVVPPTLEKKGCGLEDYVLAPHPGYPWSYAPGCVVAKRGHCLTILFYDDKVGKDISASKVYPALSPRKHCQDVKDIRQREKDWVTENAVIRDDSSGYYKLGTVKQQIGKDQRYKVKWNCSKYGEQRSIHIYGKYTSENEFKLGSHILGCVNREKMRFLPGVVRKIHSRRPDVLFVDFVDGKRCHEVSAEESFWLNKRFYQEAKEVFMDLHPDC